MKRPGSRAGAAGLAIAAGHHTGAVIAAAFAARHPERTADVLLHGTPLYSAEERAARRRSR